MAQSIVLKRASRELWGKGLWCCRKCEPGWVFRSAGRHSAAHTVVFSRSLFQELYTRKLFSHYMQKCMWTRLGPVSLNTSKHREPFVLSVSRFTCFYSRTWTQNHTSDPSVSRLLHYSIFSWSVWHLAEVTHTLTYNTKCSLRAASVHTHSEVMV